MKPFGRSGLIVFASMLLIACNNPPERARVEGESSPAPAIAGETDIRGVIAVLGDSLTAGLGVEASDNYPAQLQARIDAAGYGYRILNAGVSGDTSAQGLNRLPAVLKSKPIILIVALGANDGLRGIPVSETKRNLEEIIRKAREAGARVVLAGMEVPPNYGKEYSAQFRALFADLAAGHKLPFIPFLLEGVGGVSALNQADGIHPTAEGYARVVENVWPKVEPLLRKQNSFP